MKELMKRIADYLGLDPMPIKFEKISDDSRIYFQEGYIAINENLKDNYVECAKSIAHEMRHVFQIWYAKLMNDERAKRWLEEMKHQVNSSNMTRVEEYLSQELELYADKGISGKLINRRPQFLSLIEACREGKIDLVFCKSVQRFARNTEELLTIIRELRELRIGVVFEKENINTITAESELYLTIAAAVAEDDLTRYGQNITWTIQDKFKKGEGYYGWILYGYKIYKKSKLEINEDEAKVVRKIFEMYATGTVSTSEIAKYLNDNNIPSPKGVKWEHSQILSMLKNEKYIGDSILQKTYTEKGCKHHNKGEKQMYYVEDDHEAIIDKELWEKVRKVYDARSNKKLLGYKQKIYPFTGMIECGVCGSKYVHKFNYSGTPYKYEFWNCHNSIKNGVAACGTTGIKDKVLKEKFVEAYNEFVQNKYEGIKEEKIQSELNKLYKEEKEIIQLQTNNWISENDANDNLKRIRLNEAILSTKLNELRNFHVTNKDFDKIIEFDETKLRKFIKKVTISRWMVAFEFYNGVVIKRSFSNGTHGMIQDWTKKNRSKKYE